MQLNEKNRLNYSMYLTMLPLCFDFKGQSDGGGAFQFGITFFSVISAFWMFYGSGLRHSNKFSLSSFALLVSLIGSYIVFLTNEVPFSQFVRVIFPYFLFYIGFHVAQCNDFKSDDFEKCKKLVIVGSLISTIFTLFYGLFNSGISIELIRFQILSPLIYVLVACCAHTVFTQNKYSFLELFGLFLGLATAFYSATRSISIGCLFVCFLSIIFSKNDENNISISKKIGVFSLFIVFIVLLTGFIAPEIIERFYERFIYGQQYFGFDPTTLTRLAEIEDQYFQWSENIWTIFFGKGIGANYTFSPAYFGELIQVLDFWDVNVNWWFAGHNFWMYSLFSQGIVFGMILPIVVVTNLFLSICDCIASDKKNGDQFALPALMLCGFVLMTIGGNPMGSRTGTLYFGFALGMYCQLREINFKKY